MAVDFKSIGKFEQGALVAGVLAFILSFIDRYVTAELGPYGTYGINAWHSYATLGMILIVAALAVVAVKAFAGENLPAGAPWSLIAAAAAGVGTFLVFLRALTAGDGSSIGWSGWVLIIASLALTVFAVLSFRASGEKLPDFNTNNKGGTPPPNTPPAA